MSDILELKLVCEAMDGGVADMNIRGQTFQGWRSPHVYKLKY